MDALKLTDHRHFERQSHFHYLVNFPQRQESACKSEVNVLVLSEVITRSRSVSMKLRRASALRSRRQQREQENVPDIKAGKSSRVPNRGTFKWNTGSTCSEISSVLLSDTSSSQSDQDCIDLTVVKEKRDPVPEILDLTKPASSKSKDGVSHRASKEDERQLSKIVESQKNLPVQKVSLIPGAMAEDNLENIRLMGNAFEPELRPRSAVESPGESINLDESSTECTVASGPSSPERAVHTVRCRECERLFTRMRKQPPSKTKSRDKDPASLSCDHWVLLKKWHPQRQRHRMRGLLWTSLSKIRKLAEQRHDSPASILTQTVCSRPHVFQQRNLLRCKYMLSLQTDLSLNKAKRQYRKKQRVGAWPPVGRKKAWKRKHSVNNTLSQELSPPTLNTSAGQQKKLVLNDEIDADFMQNSDAPNEQKASNIGTSDDQEVFSGIEETRRVLKFDDTPQAVAVEPVKRRQSLRQQNAGRKMNNAWNDFQAKDSNGLQEKLSEDSDGFRTPTDLFSVSSKITRGRHPLSLTSCDTQTRVQKTNFRSMLATLVKNRDQIIKETCQ